MWATTFRILIILSKIFKIIKKLLFELENEIYLISLLKFMFAGALVTKLLKVIKMYFFYKQFH